MDGPPARLERTADVLLLRLRQTEDPVRRAVLGRSVPQVRGNIQTDPPAMTHARSITFCSLRMLPGQE